MKRKLVRGGVGLIVASVLTGYGHAFVENVLLHPEGRSFFREHEVVLVNLFFAAALLSAIALQAFVRVRHLLVWTFSLPAGLLAAAGLREAGMSLSKSQGTLLSLLFACAITGVYHGLLGLHAQPGSAPAEKSRLLELLGRAVFGIGEFGMGLILIAFGIAISIASYMLADEWGTATFTVAVGPVVGGVWLVWKELARSAGRVGRRLRAPSHELERRQERGADGAAPHAPDRDGPAT